MLEEPLGTGWPAAGFVALSALGTYLAILAYTRLAGLRSFAQISAFDFAMTVAIGSILASVAVTSSATLVDGLIALATLYAAQALVAVGRRRLGLARVVDNRPRAVMAGRQMIHDQLRAARLSHDDVLGKLRGAGVRSLDDVAVVVLETTGTVSVIRRGAGPLDPALLRGVAGAEATRGFWGGDTSGATLAPGATTSADRGEAGASGA